MAVDVVPCRRGDEGKLAGPDPDNSAVLVVGFLDYVMAGSFELVIS